MTKSRTLSQLVVSGLLVAAIGCAAKPKNSITTHTQTTAEHEDGQKVTTDVEETRTAHPDGSETVQRTETTSHTTRSAMPSSPGSSSSSQPSPSTP